MADMTYYLLRHKFDRNVFPIVIPEVKQLAETNLGNNPARVGFVSTYCRPIYRKKI